MPDHYQTLYAFWQVMVSKSSSNPLQAVKLAVDKRIDDFDTITCQNA